LFFTVFLSRPGEQEIGILLLIFAGVSYAGVEGAVSQWRLYRYGIEEALAAFSVGLLCVGIQLAFISGPSSPLIPEGEFVLPAAGALAALWIWHRFGLEYAFLAAMGFVAGVPYFWTDSVAGRHVIVAVFYVVGVVAVAAIRPRFRFTYLD